MMHLSIARDFSRTPGARYRSEGPHAGEAFREEVLLPAIRNARRNNVRLLIDCDGVAGYGTSFLEEAFGGLVRDNGFPGDELLGLMEIKSDEDEHLPGDIRAYIKEAWDAELAKRVQPTE